MLRQTKVLLALLIPTVSAGQSVPCPPAGDTARVRQVARTLITVAGLPSLSLAVGRPGCPPLALAVGFANLEDSVVADTATIYRAASVSKVIAATAALRLIEQGRLDRERRVREDFPAFPDPHNAITPRLLAAHLAGLPHYGPGSQPSDARFEWARDALGVFAAAPRIGPPGERYHYSTHGFTLLSAMMEAATGVSFLRLVDSLVARPLRMGSTLPERRDRPVRMMARLYQRDGSSTRWVRSPRAVSYSWAGAGMLTTPADLVRLSAAYSGALLNEATTRFAFEEVRTGGGVPTGVGFGWRLGEDWRGRRIIHHAGITERARSVLVMLPGQHSAVAVMTNLQWRSAIESTALMFEELALHGGVPSPSHDVDGRYVGTFRGDSLRGELRLVRGAGTVEVPPRLAAEFREDGAAPAVLPIHALREGTSVLVTPWGLHPLELRREGPHVTARVRIGSREWVLRASAIAP